MASARRSRGPLVEIRLDEKALRGTLQTLGRLESEGYVRKAVRPGVRKAASVLNKRMKKEARRLPTMKILTKEGEKELPARELSKSIGVRSKTYATSGWVVVAVGPRFTYRTKDGLAPSSVAAAIEGLQTLDALKNNPRPFARPAVKASKSEMRATFERALVENTEKVVGKLRAKGASI